MELSLTVVICVGSGLLVLAFLNWRLAVLGALFLLILEGALRKWVFPGLQEAIYLAKDLVLAGAYLRFFGEKIIHHERLFLSHQLNPFLALLFFWGLAEAFNPYLPNLLVGAFGLKAYFYYIPLFYILPELFSAKQGLIQFLAFYALCSIPISVLGIIQFFSPLDSPLVTYLGWGEESGIHSVAMVGMFPRVSGTFSYISGYVTYLFVIVLILFALLNMKGELSNVKKAFSLLALLLAIANLFMTGSRWPIYMLALLIPVVFLVTMRFPTTVSLRLFPRVAIGITFVAFALFLFFEEAITAFWERSSMSTDVEDRIVDTITTPFVFAGYSLAWGSGIGSTHQATKFLVMDQPQYSWLPTDDFEEEPERIMLELGVVGFILFYGMKLAILVNSWRLTRQLKDDELKFLAMVVFLLHLSFLTSFTVFNVTASFYSWFLSGFLPLLPKLDESTDLRAGVPR